jgi:hypothetical protein
MTEPDARVRPSRRTLYQVLVVGTLTAALLLVAVVLPAEYRIDPLGVGRATGLLQLSQPTERPFEPAAGQAASTRAASLSPVPPRSDRVEIALAAAGDPDGRDQLEWKVRMRRGDTLVYSWGVEAPPEEFYFDFHGQTPAQPDVEVMDYAKGTGIAAHGALVAPFDGIHGWYFQNQSDAPVTVRLKLDGFYEMRADPFAAE